MKTITILRLLMICIGLFSVLFLVNAFFGECTQKSGIAHGKHTLQSAEGKKFYRIFVKGDSGILDVQTQEENYPTIEMGDSVYFNIRYGLFTRSIIEMYNAHKK